MATREEWGNRKAWRLERGWAVSMVIVSFGRFRLARIAAVVKSNARIPGSAGPSLLSEWMLVCLSKEGRT